MRILHLIDGGSPQATSTTLAMMADALGRLGDVEQDVLLVGGAELRRAAEHAGVEGASVLGAPMRRAVLAWPGLRRYLREHGAYDLVHCWSVGAMLLAAMAMRTTPRVLTITTPPAGRSIQFLRMLSREAAGRTVFLPISSTLQHALLSGGIAPELVHVLRPGIDMGKVAHGSRQARRERWGVDDSTLVTALLSDPPTAADAIPAIWVVGLEAQALGEAGWSKLRLVIHPDQRNGQRARRIMRGMGRGATVIEDADLAQPWNVLPGCDVALAQGPDAGGLSLLWAMAANVPILGEATYAVSEMVEDRHSALLARPGQPKALSHRLRQLREDRQLAWALRDTARHEAYSIFSRQRYCQCIAGVYRQVIEGQAIDVPPIQMTGGLRFAGR